MTTSSVSPFETATPTPNDVITSLRRGLLILELLAGEPEGLLAKTVNFRTGLNLSTCYHLLNTLVAAGYVVKLPDTQRFALPARSASPATPSSSRPGWCRSCSRTARRCATAPAKPPTYRCASATRSWWA